jgi:GTP pyrophosphokinase
MEQLKYTPEEEERMVEEAFQDVLTGYLNSNHRKKVEIIERAYKFAKEAHKGIKRRSGEPYILHPIAVANIASQEIGLGSTSICAALLHDVV